MPRSEDQYRLTSSQLREIDQIGPKSHFNLAPPPSSLDKITRGPKFVSLTDFIEQFEWEYADLDIVDRLEIPDLALEIFWRYIGQSEVPIQESGRLNSMRALWKGAISFGLVTIPGLRDRPRRRTREPPAPQGALHHWLLSHSHSTPLPIGFSPGATELGGLW
jgi:hypothetical protein